MSKTIARRYVISLIRKVCTIFFAIFLLSFSCYAKLPTFLYLPKFSPVTASLIPSAHASASDIINSRGLQQKREHDVAQKEAATQKQAAAQKEAITSEVPNTEMSVFNSFTATVISSAWFWFILSLVLTILTYCFIPIIYAYIRGRKCLPLTKKHKILVCICSSFFIFLILNYISYHIGIGAEKTLPAVLWTFVAYSLMTPVHNRILKKYSKNSIKSFRKTNYQNEYIFKN